MAVYRTMVDSPRMTSPGALVEAGSRSAGRRREGAAAGQSGRVLRAGPARAQEGRSKLSSLTVGSPAVQIPRFLERPAGEVVGSRRPDGCRLGPLWQDSHADTKFCELACRGRRERAAWLTRKAEWPCPPKPGCAAFFTASWVCSGIVKGRR